MNKKIFLSDEDKTLIGFFVASIGIAFISWFVYFMISIFIKFVIYGILLFGICFIAHKVIDYIKNKPEKIYKIKNENIDNIVESVYNEVSKINPNISYETIKDSVIKNIKE